MQTGYGPQAGTSPEGYPIYLYADPQSKITSYVVVLPDGRAFYSDIHGRIVATPVDANKQVGLALVGGVAGFLAGGPTGAIVGALVGAIAGNQLFKK